MASNIAPVSEEQITSSGRQHQLSRSPSTLRYYALQSTVSLTPSDDSSGNLQTTGSFHADLSLGAGGTDMVK